MEPGVLFYGFILFFLLDLAPFLFVDLLEVLMSLPHSLFYSLCSVLLFRNQSAHVVLFVMLSFSKGTFWGQEYSPLIGEGRGFQPHPVSPRSWERQMAVMFEASGISHLIEETLA